MINREWMGDQLVSLHWMHGIREPLPRPVIAHWCKALAAYSEAQIESAIVSYLAIPRRPEGMPWPGDIKARISCGDDVTPHTIVEWTAMVAGQPLDAIMSDRKPRKISWPRQAGMTLACKHTDASLPTIGRAFGGRDHSTVIHARDSSSKRMKFQQYAEVYERIEDMVLTAKQATQ